MKYLKIRNWTQWQTYRKDRPGAPPWIKVHRNLMSNPDWAVLTDSEKGQLVSIWILAADRDGKIPNDANLIRKMCQLDDQPNIIKFTDLGFIESDGCQHDNQVTTTRQPHDALEERRVEESRGDKTYTSSRKRDNPPVPVKRIIDLYHELLPTLPKVEKVTKTREGYIKQRWREDLPTIKHWENYFNFVSESDFLMGKVNGNGDKPPFVASLEWLTRPSNFAKVAEEKYHG